MVLFSGPVGGVGREDEGTKKDGAERGCAEVPCLWAAHEGQQKT